MSALRLWERWTGHHPKKDDTRPARIQAQILSDIGCCRDLNEDVACCIHPADLPLLRLKGVLAIVADGMGGHPEGEVASRIAVDSLVRAYYDSPSGPELALREAFAAANGAIRENSSAQPDSKRMGATCTAVALLPGSAIFGHLGDTRLYLLHRGKMRQLTEDQTRVMNMVKQGLLSREEARNHEDRNVILQALGQRPSVEAAQWGAPFRTEIGDQFILCSDGLYDLVRDEEISEFLLQREPDAACRDLVSLAKSRGGYDNISVVLLRVVEASNNPGATGSDIQEEESPDGAKNRSKTD
jgi:serine/threonine protein phosphatase PrpC